VATRSTSGEVRDSIVSKNADVHSVTRREDETETFKVGVTVNRSSIGTPVMSALEWPSNSMVKFVKVVEDDKKGTSMGSTFESFLVVLVRPSDRRGNQSHRSKPGCGWVTD
jgi:hypothetical protein